MKKKKIEASSRKKTSGERKFQTRDCVAEEKKMEIRLTDVFVRKLTGRCILRGINRPKILIFGVLFSMYEA